MITKNTYKITDNGLLTFPKLENNFGISNFVTYNNSIWGDMSTRDTSSEADKVRVFENKIKLRKLLDSRIDLDLTTPQEDTIIYYDKFSHNIMYFNDKSQSEYRFWNIRSNSIILDKFQQERISISVEPRDCPIVVLASPNYDGVIFLHTGLSQVSQGLIEKTLQLFSSTHQNIDMSTFSAFVTPFISSKNYKLSDSVLDSMKSTESECLKYVVNNLDQELCFDFELAIVDKLLKFNITNINFTDICTYDSGKLGKLYSFRLFKDVRNGIYPELKESDVSGNFTVVISV